MSNEIINPYQTFRDSAGVVLASGTITFLVNTTTTKASIFSDEALTVAQSNPYTLDAYGRIAGDVKFTGKMTLLIKDSGGSTVRTLDNVVTQTSTANAEIIFETVALMVASVWLNVGDSVKTLGYLAIGDGGDNTYDVVAAATGTADGGRFIDLATHQAKGLFPGAKVIDLQFGVKKDNTGNYATEWQAAYDFCGTNSDQWATLELGAGNMRHTVGLTLTKRVGLKGVGDYEECLFTPVGTFDAMKVSGACDQSRFCGFKINGAGLTGRGIVAHEAGTSNYWEHIQVSGCSSHNWDILAGNIQIFVNCLGFSSTSGDGMRVAGTTGASVEESANALCFLNCRFNNNGGSGLNIVQDGDACWGVIRCEDNTGAGLRIDDGLQSNFFVYIESNDPGTARPAKTQVDLTANSIRNHITIQAIGASTDLKDSGTKNFIMDQAGWNGLLVEDIFPTPNQAVGQGKPLNLTTGAPLATSTGGLGGDMSLTATDGDGSGTNRGGRILLESGAGVNSGDAGEIRLNSTSGRPVRVGGLLYLSQAADTVAGTAAISVATVKTYLTNSGAAAPTLANGEEGQIKIIRMKTYTSGNHDVTPDGTLWGGSVIRFTADEQSCVLMYTESGWLPLSLVGCAVA